MITIPHLKNASTTTSCSFDKHRLIFIIISKQHQHTFNNDVLIQRPLSLHVCLLYFLLNSSDRNDTKHNVFYSRLLVSEKSRLCRVVALKKRNFIHVSLNRCLKWYHFAFSHARNDFLHWSTASSMMFWDTLALVSVRRCFKSLVSQIAVLDMFLH